MRNLKRQQLSYIPNTSFLLLIWLILLTKLGYSQINPECLTIHLSNISYHQDNTDNTLGDIYSFDIEVEGGSSNWEMEFKGIQYSGLYNQVYILDSFKINDGPAFLIFNDSLNQKCLGAITVFPPFNTVPCLTQQKNLCQGDTLLLSVNTSSLLSIDTVTTFQWLKNDIPIQGANNATLEVSEQGNYSVSTLKENCSFSSCCNFIVTTDGTQMALDDIISSQCPGLAVEGFVGLNDIKSSNSEYTLVATTINGVLTFDSIGYFHFQPASLNCLIDQFTYQLCNTDGGCCDTATVTLDLSDALLPSLINIPADDTIHCDEQFPPPPLISAIDNCPAISVNIEELSTQGEDGCSLYDYTLTRVWTATDLCGNSVSDQQIVEVQDIIAPDIFRIYTLPNGKKMVAGVMETVNQNWKTISLPIDFPTIPLVFTQIITTNESTPVTARIRNVSTAQFELKLQEEEGEDNKHVRENVAWIAIEEGNYEAPYPLETKKISLTDAWKTINFNTNYAVFPSFFGQLQTINDSDPAALRFQNPNLNSIQIKIEEESSVSSNVSHQTETVAFLGIEHNINLIDEKGKIFGETGSISIDENWITINTNHTYYNPIIIAGIPQHLEADPGIVRVRNVSANSFDIHFEEWNYEDGNHALEFISYLVVEGSLPLDASIICEYGTDSLEIGKDIIAIDNCDINVALQYEETQVIDENAKQFIRTWYAEDECGNATGLSQIISCTGIGLRLKAILQGASLNNNDEYLMRDDLRKKGLLPIKEPYTNMSNFDHFGGGGGEECPNELFTITGEKAVVDWVFVEIKDAKNQAIVIATKSALLLRNGEIIAADGDSILYFENIPPNNYYVALRHRNHLKVETLFPYLFSETNIPFIDFTDQFLPTLGEEAFANSEGENALWSGDLNQDEKTIYQGPNNDIFQIFLQVLLDSMNQNYLVNYINNGYTVNDFNMDGITIYQGPNNDRANLLFNTILNHPNNPTNLTNFVISSKEKPSEINLQECFNILDKPFCDYDGDGKLNSEDIDDDNDGVIDGNDVNPYNSESDSDGDGLEDIKEKILGTNPLNPCDPYQDHNTCQTIDLDNDGFYRNYPSSHSLFDSNDLNACTPNPQSENCGCSNDDNGFIFVCHTTANGQKQTLKITLEQWRLRQVVGDTCGKCE